jgi:hypothetical protein
MKNLLIITLAASSLSAATKTPAPEQKRQSPVMWAATQVVVTGVSWAIVGACYENPDVQNLAKLALAGAAVKTAFTPSKPLKAKL